MLPSACLTSAEEPVSLEGTLEVLGWVDEDGRIGYERYLDTGDTRLQLFVENPPDNCASGTRVRVDGLRLADRLVANKTGMTALEDDGSSQVNTSGGVRSESALVINVNFQTMPTRPWTIDFATDVFAKQVSQNFDEASYHHYSFQADVTGWYTINASTTTCTPNDYRDKAIAAAMRDGWVVSDYDHVVIAFPRVSACRWAGLGQQPGRYTWLNNSMRASTAIHELGHNLGLSHSHSIRCSDGPLSGDCPRTEYGDHFDRMGSAPAVVSYHGTYRVGLGWIPMSDMVNVTPDDPPTTVTIQSVEAHSGPRVVRIARPGTDQFFTVEMREPIGVDEPLSRYPYLQTGVAVYLGSTLRNQSIIDIAYQTPTIDDAPLQVGDTLYDWLPL